MSADFVSMLHVYAESEERAAHTEAPEMTSEVQDLTRRVRRSRMARTSAITAGAAAALLIGAVTVHGLTRSDPVPPATPRPTTVQTTTPTPTTTPTTTPEPSTEPAILGAVTDHAMLPAAEPLREGMLEAAGSGWSLVTHYDQAPESAGSDAPPVVLYLSSPEGTLYEVPTPVALTWDFEGIEASTHPAIVDWLPGSTLVMVTHPLTGDSFDYSVVDVLTGETALDLGVPATSWSTAEFVGDATSDVVVFQREPGGEATTVERIYRTRLDGTVVADLGSFSSSPDFSPWALSSDRTRMVVFGDERSWVVNMSDFTEIATLPNPYPDEPARCTEGLWLDDQVVLFCANTADIYNVESYETWYAGLDGSLKELDPQINASPWTAFVMNDHLILDDVGQADRHQLLDIADDGTTTPLPALTDMGDPFVVADGHLYFHDYEALRDGARYLVSVDPFTGDRTVIVSAMPGLNLGAVVHGDGLGNLT